MKKCVAVAVLAAMAGAAHADSVDVNLAGWQTFGGFGSPNNTSTTISLPVGTTIDSVEWIGLTFTSVNGSWQSELRLSVSDNGIFPRVWNNAPGGPTSGGTFGPASGVFGAGGNFTMETSTLLVTAFESFDDGGGSIQDATISAGILRINYTIPTPGALALLGMGGIIAARRRR